MQPPQKKKFLQLFKQYFGVGAGEIDAILAIFVLIIFSNELLRIFPKLGKPHDSEIAQS